MLNENEHQLLTELAVVVAAIGEDCCVNTSKLLASIARCTSSNRLAGLIKEGDRRFVVTVFNDQQTAHVDAYRRVTTDAEPSDSCSCFSCEALAVALGIMRPSEAQQKRLPRVVAV